MAHPFTVDLIEDLEHLNQMVYQFNDTSRSPEYLLLPFKNRIDSVKWNYNGLIFSEKVPVEIKCSTLETGLHLINNILYNKNEQVEELRWLDLEMIRLGFVGSLMQFLGEAGVLRVTGTANALVNILMGIDPIEVDNIMVEKNHPDFIKRFKLSFNLTNQLFRVFNFASTGTDTISKHYFEEWSFRSLVNQWQMLDFIESNCNVEQIASMYNQMGLKETMNFIGEGVEALNLIVSSLLEIDARFGGKWPQSIDTIPFIDAKDCTTLLNSVSEVVDKSVNCVNEFKASVAQGVYNPNDDPMADSVVRLSLLMTTHSEIIIQGLQAINKINEGNPEGHSELENAVKHIFGHLVMLENDLQSKQFMVSAFGDGSVKHFLIFIYIVGYHSMLSNNLTLLPRLANSLGIFLSEEGRSRFPQLYTLMLVIELTIASKANRPRIVIEKAEQLIVAAPKLNYQPRDAFSLYLLGNLAKLSLGYEKPSRFFTNVESFMKLMGIPSLGSDYLAEINDYLSKIKEALKGSDPSYDTPRANYLFVNDPFSIFKPDFSLYSKIRDYGTIKYIPFNLSKDCLLS